MTHPTFIVSIVGGNLDNFYHHELSLGSQRVNLCAGAYHGEVQGSEFLWALRSRFRRQDNVVFGAVFGKAPFVTECRNGPWLSDCCCGKSVVSRGSGCLHSNFLLCNRKLCCDNYARWRKSRFDKNFSGNWWGKPAQHWKCMPSLCFIMLRSILIYVKFVCVNLIFHSCWSDGISCKKRNVKKTAIFCCLFFMNRKSCNIRTDCKN